MRWLLIMLMAFVVGLIATTANSAECPAVCPATTMIVDVPAVASVAVAVERPKVVAAPLKLVGKIVGKIKSRDRRPLARIGKGVRRVLKLPARLLRRR